MAALEPSALIATFQNIRLIDIRAYAEFHPKELEVLKLVSEQWSAIAMRWQQGPWFVAWNPWHAPTRVRASILEEVSHIILEHKPTALVTCPVTGLPKRTFTPSKEREAYGVAGAALVPYAGLVPLLQAGDSIDDIADRYHVSPALVQMRVNVTRAKEAA